MKAGVSGDDDAEPGEAQGQDGPVIKKALVDLDGKPFQGLRRKPRQVGARGPLHLPRPDPVLRPRRGLRRADDDAGLEKE